MGNDTRRNVVAKAAAPLLLTFAGVQRVLEQRFALDAAGALALGIESSENIDFSRHGRQLPGLYLGAIGSVTYTGNYVPEALASIASVAGAGP